MSDLDELKKLLFGAEKATLDHIAERVEKRETRAVDVADILPEAIHHSHLKDDDELVMSLKDPVGVVIKQSFHEEPETYGDALYPVMGPAIRKSIMHTLRTFTQQINQAIEHSLSAKGLKWRLQAWRAGVPFGDFVLQKTLLYRVEQAYLISRENGLLISHVHHDAAKIKDSDAVSAMFTAIQDFVKESFSPDRTGRLETADMGEFTLWAVHGPHALLVCVIRGLPPRSLRADLTAILERIHFRHGDALPGYAGDTSTIQGVEEELAHCLRFEAQQEQEAKKQGLSTPTIILLLILGTVLLGVGVVSFMYSRDQARLEAVLAATAGYYVGDLERSGSTFTLRGLRDPLAPTIEEVAAEAGIEPDRIEAELRPYQSLDPEIVAQRLYSRLDTPSGVTLSIEGTTLIASGPAPLDWQEQTALRLADIEGIHELQIWMSDNDRAAVVREHLQVPLRMTVNMVDGTAVVTGTASKAWLDAARAASADLPWPVDLDSVQVSEWTELTASVSTRDGQRYFFSDGTSLTPNSAATLPENAAMIAMLAAQAADLDATLSVTLVGFTDGIGDAAINERLAGRRADVVRRALVAAGVPEDAISVESDVPESGELDLESRRVDVRLSLSR